MDLFAQSGAPFEAARSRLDLAAVLARLGQIDTARDEVRRAIRMLSSVDAAFELTRARSLESTLTAAPPKNRAHSLVRTLTTREVEVVRLIAAGHSNKRHQPAPVHQRSHGPSSRRQHPRQTRRQDAVCDCRQSRGSGHPARVIRRRCGPFGPCEVRFQNDPFGRRGRASAVAIVRTLDRSLFSTGGHHEISSFRHRHHRARGRGSGWPRRSCSEPCHSSAI